MRLHEDGTPAPEQKKVNKTRKLVIVDNLFVCVKEKYKWIMGYLGGKRLLKATESA